jgi:hypothetical protein
VNQFDRHQYHRHNTTKINAKKQRYKPFLATASITSADRVLKRLARGFTRRCKPLFWLI